MIDITPLIGQPEEVNAGELYVVYGTVLTNHEGAANQPAVSAVKVGLNRVTKGYIYTNGNPKRARKSEYGQIFKTAVDGAWRIVCFAGDVDEATQIMTDHIKKIVVDSVSVAEHNIEVYNAWLADK